MDIEIEASVKGTSTRPYPQAGLAGKRQRAGRPRETEEGAIIRRFHDAQRMARFRARKRKALEDQQLQLKQLRQLEANGIVVCRSGSNDSDLDNRGESRSEPTRPDQLRPDVSIAMPETENKYAQLLAIIERIGRDVRLSYAGSRSSAERLKSGIVKARGLVRDCLIETSLNLRQ